MARSIEQIYNGMIQDAAQDPVLGTSLTSTSRTAHWRLLFFIVATAHWALEVLMDFYRADVEKRIASTRPHTRVWYREQALRFQYGHQVVSETDYYDNTGIAEADVLASKIIANAAVTRIIVGGAGALRLKAVAWNAGPDSDWTPLSEEQVAALSSFMNNDVTDAGTPVIVTSTAPDDLKLVIDMYFDPQVISQLGERLDGSDQTPVLNAIKSYLKSLEFNGSLVLSKLEDHLKSLYGFPVAHIRLAASKYAGYNYTDQGSNVGEFSQIRVADAGWMELDLEASVINYIEYQE